METERNLLTPTEAAKYLGLKPSHLYKLMNTDKIAEDLMEILRAMPSWSWDDYVARVRSKGKNFAANPKQSRYSLSEKPDQRPLLLLYQSSQSLWHS